jgi:membrane-bound lytic murein transglycosylase F
MSTPRRSGWRPVWLLPLLAVLTLAGVPVLHGAQLGAVANDLAGFGRYKRFTTYDQYFTKYSKRFFGVGFDWRYFKAQAVAESNLRPDVRSSVGAIGLMQVMPRTFDEIRRKNPAIAGSAEQPRWNIAAGIWYDRQQFLVWAEERSLVERLKFMFGSYNAGRANILRAQRFALGEGLNATLWESVAGALPRVTGRRSQETVSYVSRVFDIKQALR